MLQRALLAAVFTALLSGGGGGPAVGGWKRAEKTVTTDADGAYRVVLAPGTYTVRTARAPVSPMAQVAPGQFGGPAQVMVTAGKTVTADFIYLVELR